MGYDKIGSERIIQSFPQYEWREKLVVDNVTSQLYGATTGFNDNMPVIKVKSQEGQSMLCQIGSEAYSQFYSGPPPIILNDKTYVSIAFVDRFLAPNTDIISLYRVVPSENFKSEFIHYGTYKLTEYQFN